ncbi:Anthranilate N-benzoyltransferase protein 3-like protein [Mycena venus]|uniref:Anthranilate N-benzoyltransferase protein 3-like protein n=1 Tax=Mycena venus TaxID=2733690 RepID=A0A8H7CIJ9_9AGAR|nr:Anthranilate N-benzoyltransferase protein 3-like protein [Mycena venus]
MTNTSSNSVTVIARHPVVCANESSWKALESPFRLGAFDQVAGFVPIQVVWVYEQSSSNIELIPVERLQRAMERLLDYYPQLSGRIQINSDDGTREIARLGTGTELLEVRCSERLDAFSSRGLGSPESRLQDLPGAGNALLAPFDPTPDAVCRDPIFTVRHTRFACGSVALGVRCHHSVCDADGFFQLVRDLAELYRGFGSSENTLAHPPHIRPYMSELVGGNMSPRERQAALDFQTPLFYVNPIANTDSATADTSASAPASLPPPPPPVEGRFFRFSSARLAALKALATDPSGSGWISTFDALAAYVYQRVLKARLRLSATDPNFGELSPTDFLTPINLRGRLSLPARYFHNTLFTSYTTIPSDMLTTGPLWQVAKIVHDVTRTSFLTSKDGLDGTLKWIAAQPDTRTIQSGFRYGNGSFMVSQWNKFDMYAGSVFDVAPVLVSPPFTQSSLVDGLAYFLSTEEIGKGGDAGAIDLSLALAQPLWAIMDKDNPLV